MSRLHSALEVLLLLTSLVFETGNTQSNVTNTAVQMPPAITASSQKLIYYRTDVADSKLLECGAVGSPVPTYEWYKNNMLLDLNQANIKLQGQGSILISPLTTFDAGLYQCFATNTWGTAATNLTSFQWATLSAFSSSGSIASQAPSQGSPCSLDCRPPSSVPAASYTWVKSNGQSDQFPTPVTLDNRIQVDQVTGNLHFANVVPADSTSGSILYRCGAYNPYLQNSNGGSFNTLTVNSVSNPATTSPSPAFQSSSPMIAVVGRSIRLSCFFYGNPTPTVTWKRKTGELPVNRTVFSNANTVLTIYPVDSSDQGVYECTGQNSVGTVTLTIQLSVQAEPTFISGPVNINVTDGQNVSFSCDVSGIPNPTIMWFQNSRALDPYKLPAKFSLSSDLKVLTINNVCKQCAGGQSDLQVIQCNATNTQGYAYGSGYLNVLTQTQIVDYPKSQALVYNAETVLTCGTSHDPSTPVTVSWYFNDQPFVNYPGRVYTDADGNIHFNTPSLANGGAAFAGNYTCNVSNGYSQDQASAIISPAAMVYQSSIADFWWIFLIIAVIVSLIIATVLIVLHMRRNRGDAYPVDEKERDNGNDPEKELADGAFQDYQRSEVKTPLIPPGSMSDSMQIHSDAGSSMNEYATKLQSKFDDNGSFINSIAGHSQPTFQY